MSAITNANLTKGVFGVRKVLMTQYSTHTCVFNYFYFLKLLPVWVSICVWCRVHFHLITSMLYMWFLRYQLKYWKQPYWRKLNIQYHMQNTKIESILTVSTEEQSYQIILHFIQISLF